MYKHEQKSIIDYLVKGGFILEENKLSAFDYFSKYWDDKIAIIWTTEDVKEVNDKLTEEECQDVLSSILDSRDANYGISWDTIRSYIEHTHPEKEEGE